ncbi:hypothetical protein V8B97DRAFT_2007048 [Scleroderma yunnanense]
MAEYTGAYRTTKIKQIGRQSGANYHWMRRQTRKSDPIYREIRQAHHQRQSSTTKSFPLNPKTVEMIPHPPKWTLVVDIHIDEKEVAIKRVKEADEEVQIFTDGSE